MYNRRVFIVSPLLLIQSFCITAALYISPGYEHFVRNKRAENTVCVQIKPNGVDGLEPYYMCKGPEFPPKQLIVPLQFLKPNDGSFIDFNHQQPALQQVPNGETQTLQFGNAHQLMPQSPQNEGGYFYNTKPSKAPEIDHYSSLPATVNFENHHSDASHLQNNYENIRISSKTDISTTNGTKQNDENANARNAQIMKPSEKKYSNLQQTPTDAAEHNINPEQFKALLEEEVLGTPNLAFSPDEMLPFRNMYTEETKLEKPLTSERFLLPPEYMDDPILRTFYDIDHDGNTEEPNKPILQEEDIKNCHNLLTYSMMYGHLPQSETNVPIQSSKCGDCPLTYQPIFIAIPWPTPLYNHDQRSKIYPPISCGNEKSFDNSYRSKSRANNDNSSTEDLIKKDSAISLDVPKNLVQPQKISTKTPESSEEDLFVDDTTAKANDEKSDEDEDDDDKKVEIVASSTSVPNTTVRTFKTMMHAAKMLSQLANVKHNPPPQPQNKRHIHYIAGTGYPSNLKKEYLRKLETNFY